LNPTRVRTLTEKGVQVGSSAGSVAEELELIRDWKCVRCLDPFLFKITLPEPPEVTAGEALDPAKLDAQHELDDGRALELYRTVRHTEYPNS
jgi:hypothetical protein